LRDQLRRRRSGVSRTGADQNASSKTITAGQLGMTTGDTKYLFARAADNAFQLSSGDNGGNEGELSTSTQVNAVETSGACGETCGGNGCSVAPMWDVGGELGWFAGLVGLGFAISVGRRRLR